MQTDTTTTMSGRDIEDLPSILSVDQVAAFLNVNKKTVYGSIEAGHLHAIRIGASRRTIRIYRDAVRKFVNCKKK